MEVQGKVKVIGKTQTVGSSGFQKRELVVSTEEQYPQHLMIEFVQDKTALLDSYNVGDSVKVGINLRGREWQNPQGETKYFNSIQGWRIDKLGNSNVTSDPAPKYDTSTQDDEEDDLPF